MTPQGGFAKNIGVVKAIEEVLGKQAPRA